MTVADQLLEALEERDSQLTAALAFAGRLHELQHELSIAAADIDDNHLSAAVAAIRKPVIDAGNRLAALRHPH